MENTIDFVPRVYSRKDIQSVVDRKFREFGQVEEEDLNSPDQASLDIQPLLDEITLLRSQSVADQQTILNLQTELASIKASAAGSSI